MDGTPEGYGVYPVGPQVLDGLSDLNFTRLQRQNLVLWGL